MKDDILKMIIISRGEVMKNINIIALLLAIIVITLFSSIGVAIAFRNIIAIVLLAILGFGVMGYGIYLKKKINT